MSKPTTLRRNSDKSYRHINAGSWKIYSVNHPDVLAVVRSVHNGKGWIAFNSNEQSVDTVDHGYLYGANMLDIVHELDQQTVTVKNIMTGEDFQESLTLPYNCSVASESYWSA
jgi:hypothetical protein